jgi:hypothetical protein
METGPNTAIEPTQAKQTRTWGMVCHLSALAGFIGVPFGNILGPLVVWLVKKDEMPFVDEQGKESLNFQISITIYSLVAAVLCLVLIGFVLLLALLIVDLVLVIVATASANKGQSYRYPFTLRLV